MKKKNISPNARQAFQNYKEELAKDIEFDLRDRDDHITKMVEDEKSDKYTHLERS